MSVVENFILNQDDFRLKVDRVELLDQGVTALCGPSGSGKSTFAKALLGLLPVESGIWTFDGQDLLSQPAQSRRLGVVFQDFALFPHLTANENIWFAAQARSIPKHEAQQSLLQLTESLQLTHCQNTKANKLSGGEAQRTALARALMGRPRFLILDEAFASLDADNKERAYILLEKVLKETEVPTLLITHDENEVQRLANKRLSIVAGSINEVN